MSIELYVPIGTNLSTNSSPSLSANTGAVGMDNSTNQLYLGVSGTWTSVTPSITSSTSLTATLNNGTQTAMTGTLYLQSTTIGSIKMVQFDYVMNQVITGSPPSGTWSSASSTVPAGYLPTLTRQYPIFINNLLSINYVSINTSGVLSIYNALTAVSLNLGAYSGIYYV